MDDFRFIKQAAASMLKIPVARRALGFAYVQSLCEEHTQLDTPIDFAPTDNGVTPPPAHDEPPSVPSPIQA